MLGGKVIKQNKTTTILTYDEGEKYVCKGVEQLGGQI
jgi:hypothetical protein